MRIYKRGDMYYGDFTVNGTRVRKRLSTNRKTACKMATALEYNYMTGEYTENTTLAYGYERFRYSIENSGVTPRQQRFVLHCVDAFMDWAKCSYISDVTPQIAHSYIMYRFKDMSNCRYANGPKLKIRIKPTTVNKTIQTLKRFFNFCVDMEYTSRNPFRSVKLLKVPKRQRYSFTRIEQSRIKKCEGFGEFFEFLLETGLRCTDGFTITSDDVYGNYLNIRTRKTNDVLEIPLSDRALEIIEGKSGLLFPEVRSHRKQKTARKALQGIFTVEYVRKHSIALHTLRHTYAHNALDKGMPKEVLQTFMGHQSITTTEIYANWVKRSVLDKWV